MEASTFGLELVLLPSIPLAIDWCCLEPWLRTLVILNEASFCMVLTLPSPSVSRCPVAFLLIFPDCFPLMVCYCGCYTVRSANESTVSLVPFVTTADLL